MSVKSPLRNFNDIKQSYGKGDQYQSSLMDTANISLQLGRITKMIEDSVMKFTKKYLVISTELEEMKREFIAQASLITEYLTLTKKEIRFDKFENFNQGKQFVSMPSCPLYEQKCITRSEKRDNKLYKSVVNFPSTTKKRNFTKQNLPTTNSSISSNNRLFSPTGKSAIKNFSKEFDSNSTVSYVNHTQGGMVSNNGAINRVSKLKKNLLGSEISNSNTLSEEKINRKKKFANKKKFLKSTVEMNEDEKNEYHSNIIKSIKNPFIKATYTLINSPILSLNEKLNFGYLNHEISSYIIPPNLVYDSLSQMEKELEKKLEIQKKYSPLPKDETILTAKLSSHPSKTAKTGLTFLTPDKERDLIYNESEITKELNNMIYSCLNLSNSNYDNLKDSYDNLFNLYHVNSIKSLFNEVIYKEIYSKSLNENFDLNTNLIISTIENNKELITECLVGNTNKTFSYVAFSLEEIVDYLKEIQKIDKKFKMKIKNEIEIKTIQDQINNIKKVADN